MSEAKFQTFLMDNGHILMLMTKTDTIEAALAKIVSVSACAEEIRNFFDIDPVDLYWEYNLLEPNKSCTRKHEIDVATKARYNHIMAIRVLSRKK